MPGSIRLFVAAPLLEGAEIAALPGQAHYLGHVMRRRAGEEVLLFNGADGEWRARIAAIGRDRARFEVLERTRPQLPEPDLWLCFALLKRDATDLVVEKATELGASRILPVITERTQAARVNLERLAAIATEAAEQCERLSVPALHEPVRLAELLAGWPAGRGLAVAVERAGATIFLVPPQEYRAAMSEDRPGLRVYAVSSLDQALSVLAAHGGTVPPPVAPAGSTSRPAA